MTYLALLLVVILVNCLPAFAPPTWTILVFFLTAFNLNLGIIVLCGVIGATLGRFILSNYIQWFSHQLFNEQQNDNLGYLGHRIGDTFQANFIFTFLYSLTPLSTTALFVAAGIARVKIAYVLLGFFAGRLISYTALALSTRAVAVNITELTHGIISWESVLSAICGLLVLFGFIFIDWRQLLEKKHFKLNFRIWRWNKERPTIRKIQ